MAGMARSGFKRTVYVPPAPAPIQPLETPPNYGTKPWSNGGRPKDPRIEIPHLLEMARRPGQICLLRVPGTCPGFMQRDDCCAAHGNGAAFNKGLGLKAHDFFTVRACARCHAALDSTMRATGEERAEWFLAGLDRQVIEWRYLYTQPLQHKDWVAIGEALRNLRERGYTA